MKNILCYLTVIISGVVFTACKGNSVINAINTPFVYGIDISSYQGAERDILKKYEDSLTFIICRATIGITEQDSSFQNNWHVLRKEFTVGAYHFYESNDEPMAQCQNYLNTVGQFGRYDLPPIIDVENEGIHDSQSVSDVQENLKSVLKIIEDSTNRVPIIYTNLDIGNWYLNDPFFGKYPLWIADYSSSTSPVLPLAWHDKDWSIWQKSDHYYLEGTKNDLNVFNGDLHAFRSFIRKH